MWVVVGVGGGGGGVVFFFFFNDTATTEIYTLSLHDALPISAVAGRCLLGLYGGGGVVGGSARI